MKFDKFWTNLELRLTNLGRYLPIFWPVFLVFSKTEFLAAYWYFFPNKKKILAISRQSTSLQVVTTLSPVVGWPRVQTIFDDCIKY
jgi:hypothetical protein